MIYSKLQAFERITRFEQRDFNLPDGLADHSKIRHEVVNEQVTKGNHVISKEMHRVQILDPATGTGTFLAEAVNQIYDKFRGMQGMWQSYVDEHLLPRLHGFEILMASYAIAHLKLDMLLSETGYKHLSDRRLKIYLTNSLEECHPDTGTLFSTWLSDEANEANRIKRDCPVMVMMGNPPYSGESQNKGEWIMKLMESYKKEPGGTIQLQERNPKWINDDYVKFIRLAQDYVTRNGSGIIGFINPHGFLDNPTFRGMRWNLLKTFDNIYTINLHGNSKKKETCPDGSPDENVFDIMQGVSINIFVKTGKKKDSELGKVFYYDLFGKREEKYSFLSDTPFSKVEYKELKPTEPMYFFVPKDFTLEEEYSKGISVNEIFINNSVSIVTAKDKILVDNEKRSLYKKVLKEYGESKEEFIQDYAYRPFDKRYVYYDTNLIERPRESLMRNFINRDNIALLTCRQLAGNDWCHVSIADCMVDDCRVSNKTKERGYVFPLYLYPNSNSSEKVPNLNPEEWRKFDVAVGRGTSPEEVLAYVYAVLHSPSYRERYKEFLKVDFPRIPLPENEESFERLVKIGYQLIDLHLMKDANRWNLQTTFPEAGSQLVERYKYIDGCVWINETQYFGNVPESAWRFYIGGYQPAQKWLKDRVGRTLSFDKIRHYMQIVHALAETERIMSG